MLKVFGVVILIIRREVVWREGVPVFLLGRLVGHLASFGGEGRVPRLPPLVGFCLLCLVVVLLAAALVPTVEVLGGGRGLVGRLERGICLILRLLACRCAFSCCGCGFGLCVPGRG